MILKLGLQHQRLKFYKVYINGVTGLTLTYFMARSNWVSYRFEWGKLLQCYLMGVVCLYPGAKYMYMTIIFNKFFSVTASPIKAKYCVEILGKWERKFK